MLAPLALVIILFLLFPMAFVIWESFNETGRAGFSLANYTAILTERRLRNAFGNSFLLAITTAVFSLILGFVLSYAVFLTRGALRRWLSAFTAVPLAFSGLVVAYGFIITFGMSGSFTLILNRLFGVNPLDFSAFLFTWYGLSFAYMYFLIPRVILTVVPAWDQVNWSLLDAAESLGASGVYTFRRILLPQLVPSLIAASSLVFAVAMGAYGTAYALSGVGINIVPLAVLSLISEARLDFNQASALAVGLTLMTLVVVLTYERIVQGKDRS